MKKKPPKALGRVFWWFLIIFGHVFFWSIFSLFLPHFWSFGRSWGSMKMLENGSKLLKKHQRNHFLAVWNHFGWVWSGFGSFWRVIFFFIFGHFRTKMTVKGPSVGPVLVLLVLFPKKNN